jgi:hypothetical protein
MQNAKLKMQKWEGELLILTFAFYIFNFAVFFICRVGDF